MIDRTHNFTLKEFTKSKKADEYEIDNIPDIATLKTVLFTMAGMDRVRAFLGHPCNILSGYRCELLNKLVGGVVDNPLTKIVEISQHVKGEACDFVCPGFGSPRLIVIHLVDNLKILGIDQLILEGSWVHISFTLTPRYEVLTLKGGKYLKGVV